MVRKIMNENEEVNYEDLDVVVNSITFKLRYRNFSELSKRHLEILDRYRFGLIDYYEAHNSLIQEGFNLQEDNVIVDY